MSCVSVCNVLYRSGMTPNVTLHWFAHPQWFQDLGEFQKEENIPLFVDWAEAAFALFGMHSHHCPVYSSALPQVHADSLSC